MLLLVVPSFLLIAHLANGQEGDAVLAATGLQKVMECAGESGVDFGTCIEMLKPGAKLDDEKYKPCKCMVPCVSKKMKMMEEDGSKFIESEILKTVNDLKTPGYKEEGLRVYELCKKVEGTGCELGFNMVECILKNSEKARQVVDMLVKTMLP